MPLHDWSVEPPVPYESFHTAWISEIVRYLNREALPAGYRAYGERHLGVLRPDVTTFQEGAPAGKGAAPRLPAWQATVSVAYDAAPERYSVRVENAEGRPVAFLELVSPSNKESASARERFVDHLVVHVTDGLHLILVDVFSEPPHNLHAQLIDALDSEVAAAPAGPPPLVASYRNVGPSAELGRGRLEAVVRSFLAGERLPPTVLWIGEEQAVELDLEQLYQETCVSLRFE